MTPQEMKQLAELLQNVPGIKSVELKDVEELAQLLRQSPEIGSIEVKGWFGTGVVITRTASGPVYTPVPAAHMSPAPALSRVRPAGRSLARPLVPPRPSRKSARRWSARSTRPRSPAPIPT